MRPLPNKPRWAVVSVARSNRYGLPDEEVLVRWDTVGITVLQTATEGAIEISSDGRQVNHIQWR